MIENKKSPETTGLTILNLDDIISQNQINSNPVKIFREFKTIGALLQHAKSKGLKGDWYSYNYYKTELSKFIVTNFKYKQVIKELILILEV
jgi:hypothetical protein